MPNDCFSLAGKVALVTGASRGIGRSIATVFARAGADLAVMGRSAARLEGAAADVTALGRRVLMLEADVSVASDVRRGVDEARRTLGRIDILVNNAGVALFGRVEDVSENQWDEILDVNLKGAFLLSQAVSAIMREQRGGRIVNIASIAAETGGVSGSVAYSASKGGVVALTKTLARDLAPYGVTVNAICPGQIMTDMSRQLTPEQLEKVVASIPMHRVGEPEDIAHAALFLASDEASYITGAALDVNGGILMR